MLQHLAKYREQRNGSVISCTIYANGTLGIGTNEEIFQLEGGQQHLMEELNIFVTDGAIASAVAFSTRV